MGLIGYARVSTDEQTTDPQSAELSKAGCLDIRKEYASGASRSRPVLRKIMETVRAGDVLVVVRIDRLARSLSHLLEVIEALEARGAHFKSLHDPIDTSSPQGRFTLQILGAAAEFERALIRERTMAGLASARSEGRIGGNRSLKALDVKALKTLSHAREEAYFRHLQDTAELWVPIIRRMRPHSGWKEVLIQVNNQIDSQSSAEKHWTLGRLMRAVHFYVSQGFLSHEILAPAARKIKSDRPLSVVSALAAGNPDMTLDDMCAHLTKMRERTPRGGLTWSRSTVSMLLERARQQGIISRPDRRKGRGRPRKSEIGVSAG